MIVVGDFLEQIDDKGGIEEISRHPRRIRKRASPMRFTASASTSAAVSKGCSRMSLRTKLACFIPARRERRASNRSSSSVSRTVRMAMVIAILDVCHLYVRMYVRNAVGLDAPVMNTREELQQAFIDFQSGRF